MPRGRRARNGNVNHEKRIKCNKCERPIRVIIGNNNHNGNAWKIVSCQSCGERNTYRIIDGEIKGPSRAKAYA